MTTPLSIAVPFPVFQDRDGQPLENGYIWLGVPNLNPQTNPIIAYYDDALTIVAPQPLRTLNGYISRAGTPAQVYVDGVNFSILVQDSKGSMVYNFPEGTGISTDACGVTYNPPFAGAVAYPVCEKLEQTVSIKDFGAVGDGVFDDTVAIQAALTYANSTGSSVYCPAGTYKISDQITVGGANPVIVFGDGDGTKILQTGAAYAFKVVATRCQINDMQILGALTYNGASTALGGIWVQDAYQSIFSNLDFRYFGATNANAIYINESYWIKLSNVFVYRCFTALKVRGYVTTFEWDKGGIDLTYPTGKAVDAIYDAASACDLHFNQVYFESCEGDNPIQLEQFGEYYFTDCGFEAMCVNNTSGLVDPKIISTKFAAKLTLDNCSFSGFSSTTEFYSGEVNIVKHLSGASLTVNNCVINQSQVFPVAVTAVILFWYRNFQTLATFSNNVVRGAGWASAKQAEIAFYYQDGIYTTYNATYINNQVLGVTKSVLPKYLTLPRGTDATPNVASPIVAPGGANTIVFTNTFYKETLGTTNGFIIKAWGRRTGTAGAKQIVFKFTDTGAATSYNATNASTATDAWETEITVYFRLYNSQSINIVSHDAAASLTQSELATKNSILYDLVVELEAQVANAADTMTLDGVIMDRF